MAPAELEIPIPDRATAGRALAELLAGQGGAETLVLALPRGGVPVAYEIAEALGSPLDLMLVRKLGVPGHEELAMGAIASGGVRVLNEDILRSLGITDAAVEPVERREAEELARRERAYRGERPMPELRDKRVILVDDGIATGATMRAAVQAARQLGPVMSLWRPRWARRRPSRCCDRRPTRWSVPSPRTHSGPSGAGIGNSRRHRTRRSFNCCGRPGGRADRRSALHLADSLLTDMPAARREASFFARVRPHEEPSGYRTRGRLDKAAGG